MAWLDSVIKTEGDSDEDPVTRRERMISEEIEILLPECDAFNMVEILYEIGPAESAGMGATALSHLQIRAYQDNIGIDLTPWQVRTLRSMSIAYCRQLSISSDWNTIPPFTEKDQLLHNRERVQSQFKALLSGFSVKSYKK